MVGVDETRVLDAVLAVIPVGAVEALVTDTSDILVTTIADGVMDHIAARCKASRDGRLERSTLNSGNESVLGVVAMLILSKAVLAEVEIFTSSAVKEFLLRELFNAAVAGAGTVRRSPS